MVCSIVSAKTLLSSVKRSQKENNNNNKRLHPYQLSGGNELQGQKAGMGMGFESDRPGFRVLTHHLVSDDLRQAVFLSEAQFPHLKARAKEYQKYRGDGRIYSKWVRIVFERFAAHNVCLINHFLSGFLFFLFFNGRLTSGTCP